MGVKAPGRWVPRLGPASILVAVMLATTGLLGDLGRPVLAARAPRPATPLLPSGFSFGFANQPSDIGWMIASGVPWGYRYQYLAGGVNTGTGWETWNTPSGPFAGYYMANSASNGYFPVFSYYELLQSTPSSGTNESDRDFNNLNNASTMNAYYANFVLLMHQAATYGGEVIVQVEPDLWGYLEQRAGGGLAASLSAKVKSSGFADVAGIDDTFQGFAGAFLHLRDKYAPSVLLASHASPGQAGSTSPPIPTPRSVRPTKPTWSPRF